MTFGLLLQHLPHIQESRANYDALLSLQFTYAHRLARWWRALLALVS